MTARQVELQPKRRGYLVLSVSTDPDGKNVIARFWAPHRLIQPSFHAVAAVALRNGYEVMLGSVPAAECGAWPLRLHAYTSTDVHGVGRDENAAVPVRRMLARLQGQPDPGPAAAPTGPLGGMMPVLGRAAKVESAGPATASGGES